MHTLMLVFHLLGACIWVGGHLYLCICLLPNIVRKKDVAGLLAFEQSFERLGMSALVVQVVTGVAMAKLLLPDLAMWTSGAGFLLHTLYAKFILLALTVMTALHARFRVIPRLSQHNLGLMAWHVVIITILSVAFLVVGLRFRFG